MSGRLDKAARICRREVLLPGELLPEEHRAPGKHHGTVTKVVQIEGGGHLASVTMTDFGKLTKKLKLEVPLERVLPFLLPKKAERPKSMRFEAERCHEPPAGARPAPTKKRKKAAGRVPQRGQELAAYMKRLEAVVSARHPPGTRLWVRVPGSGRSPGVSWSFRLCKRRDMGQLLTSYRQGLMCVKFYGEHSLMWVREEDCEQPPENESELIRQFKAWGRQHNKMRLVELALDEVVGAHGEPEKELRRMVLLYDQYLQTRQALDNCYLCRELGARLQCGICDRLFHPLCLLDPALDEEEILEGAAGNWACPCCGEDNVLGEEREEEGDGEEGAPERMGLTPDWLIEAAAFRVFELERPHARRPYIPRLLDPCTNSKLAPNIPAEVLYDKRDNGLKLSNSWAGYYIVLNPDYRAQVQWRFVNRCIDEVENGAVPAAILICRNSTDTAYFQRLRPYPRVLLRRMSARFKDYDKTPIGFGIAVFCIAKSNCRELYERFFDAFEPMGEPNVPVDKTFIQTPEYIQLLDRLRSYASQHHRDHWVQCSECEKWRIVDFQTALDIGDDDEWTCALLRPPNTSCDTPLSKREMMGGRYAAGGADFLDLTPQEEEGEGSEGMDKGEGGEGVEGAAQEEKEDGGEAAAKKNKREGGESVAKDAEGEVSQQLGSEGRDEALVAPAAQRAVEGGARSEAEAGTGGRSRPEGSAGAGAEAGVPPGQSGTGSSNAESPAALQPALHAGAAGAAAAACIPTAGAPPAVPPQAPQPTLQSSFQSVHSTGAAHPAMVGPLPSGMLAPWLLPPAAWQNPALRPLLLAAAAARRPLFGVPGPAGMHVLRPMPAVGSAAGPAGVPQPVPPGVPGQPLPQPLLPQQQGLPPGAALVSTPPLLPPLVFNLPSGAALPPFLPFPPTPLGRPPLPTVASPTALTAAARPLAMQSREALPAPTALATAGSASTVPGKQLPSSEKESSSAGAWPAGEEKSEGCQGTRQEQEAEAPAGPGPAASSAEAARQPPPLPHPLPPAEEVVCEKTLRDLISLPPRNITLDREEGDSGQVLTALELARQARIAANRAYLAGLGLGPAAMHGGQVQPLAPGDPVMLQAARELATQAAAEEAKRQLTRMQQRYEAARRRRAKQEPQLLAQLRALKEEEEEAARELAAAEVAAQEFKVAEDSDG